MVVTRPDPFAFLAGDVRWQLHDPEGARLEYAEAKRLDPDVVATAVLEERLHGSGQLAAPLLRAAGVAARNGWLAFASAFLLGLLGWTELVRQKMSSTPDTWS